MLYKPILARLDKWDYKQWNVYTFYILLNLKAIRIGISNMKIIKKLLYLFWKQRKNYKSMKLEDDKNY